MSPTHSWNADLIVIGGGSGGVRAARMAAGRGAKVVLVESGAMGGTCVNVGCIPKKLYSYAAGYGEAFAEARGYGWQVPGDIQLDWGALKAARAKEITRLNGIYEGLMSGAKVERINGKGSLVDAHTVAVHLAGGEQRRITAAHILLATGGQPVLPDVPGKEHAIVSDQMFDLPQLPRRMAVVGGGYIGCEMASIFHGLGVEVTLLYRGEQILRGFDDEVRDFVATEMRKTGVQIQLHTDVKSISLDAASGERVLHLSDGRELRVDQVLYAAGRKPNVAGLGLEALGIAQSKGGAIEVDEHFATSVPSVYALGDVVGRLELTPVALAEAMAWVDHVFGPAAGKTARRMDYENIPTAVFTHPEIGTVGLGEAAARERFGKVRIYRSDFKPLRHTLSGSSGRCLVKLVVDDASDRVVGLHVVGQDAAEMAQGFAVAMKAGATKAVFDQTIGIHPTMAEELVTLRELSRT
ncbi:glutathione-disulfide reductase [Comamonas sp. J-3]|uniref:glutathione-disulfide reductase n=1 Tax=Comamonas trifloxystrobinivorans TaxID=3350256 RepID=UPI003726E3A9